MVVLLVDGTNDVEDGEPPMILLLVPYGSDLVVVVESYRFLALLYQFLGRGHIPVFELQRYELFLV